jgi:pSer/pThr/pTyr-binding forkhead associated (FHA) protein
MRVVMVMFRADGQRRSFSVTRDITVIGRREDCDLRIPLGDVSRKHCRLILDGDNIRVEDLGSSNGTFRNGERVQQTELSAGDTLQVGPVVFVLQVNGAPADDELQPVTAQTAAGSKGKTAEPHETTTTTQEESLTAGEFDPMEALEANEGSAFDFQIDESQHGTPIDLEESGAGQ